MGIKAIMCDVDGTLLNSDKVVSPFTLKMIKEVRKQGILFGLCTGRDVFNVKQLLKAWQLDGLVDAIVGTGGAEIVDFTLNIEESSFPLDGEIIKEVVRHFEDMDVNFAIPYQGELMAPKDDVHIKRLAAADFAPYRIIDYNEFLKEPKSKVMIVTHPEKINEVVERSKTFTIPNTKSAGLITASILYEYMDPRVTKSYGLQKIMELHGWTMDELCTFGDADNDYDMTLNAGIGVVMANGSDKTKSAADYVTYDNNHDGIGKFIEQHFLIGTMKI